jgi:hypothetical protein
MLWKLEYVTSWSGGKKTKFFQKQSYDDETLYSTWY